MQANIPVSQLLSQLNIPFTLIPLTRMVKSHGDVAQATSQINLEDDCKTIVVQGKSGKYFALFLRGMQHIDFAKVAMAIGEKLSIISDDELLHVTGKTKGSVCPLLLKNIEIWVDRAVLQRKQLFFSSGEKEYGLSISTADFLKITEPKFSEFSK